MNKSMIRRKTPLCEGVSKLCKIKGQKGEWSNLENSANRPQVYEELDRYVCDLDISDGYWIYVSECIYVGDLLSHEGWSGAVVDRISAELKKIGLKRHMFTGYWKQPKAKLRDLDRELDGIREDITYLTRKRQIVTKLRDVLENRIEAAKEAKQKADEEFEATQMLLGVKKRKPKETGEAGQYFSDPLPTADPEREPEPDILLEWPMDLVDDSYEEAIGELGVRG